MTYSFLRLAREALTGNVGWTPAWREPKPKYDVLVIGGGGHGLATAYYLAKEHGITNVAVLEKGWIGSGNAGRNTTSSAPTICFRAMSVSTSTRCSCGRGWSRT